VDRSGASLLARGSPSALAVGDGLALIVFVVVGVLNHDGAVTPGLVLRTAVPLLGAWYAAALLAGAYRRPGLLTLFLTWLPAVPVAVLIRSFVAGGPWGGELAVFLGVALAFTMLFVLTARVVVGAVQHLGWRRA
jgi:hypothetical protein